MLNQPKKFCMKLFWALRWRVKRYLPGPVSRRLRRLTPQFQVWRFKLVLEAYDTEGCDSAIVRVESLKGGASRAKAYLIIARKEIFRDVLSAASLARKSFELDDSESNRRRVCMILWDAGDISEAYRLLQSIPRSALTIAERARALQIRGAYELYTNVPALPPSACTDSYASDASCIMYVASSSQPYHTTGYTTRTHHLLEAIRGEGWSVHCVTRPGYPADRPDSRSLDAPPLNLIDEIPYERVSGKHRREVQYDRYIQEAADALEKIAYRLRPALIHAASNYEAGLPALMVARRLGIPFCYEVRGLWEYTAASKKPGWERSERFALDRMLETHVAKHADQVFTLTRALATELVQRGVNEERIKLLPNAVNLEFFKQTPKDHSLAEQLGIGEATFVCGYIGSIAKYEGLDDLITALPALIRRVPDSRFLVVGDGDELVNLREQAERLGVSGHVTFTGRVAHAEVKRYFSLFSAIALPRKPYTVCKLVSPLKPFEAMAMRVPLIVSDVDALGEIFEHGETALLHKAGDVDSLAAAMISLAESPVLRQRLADNAFDQVSRHSQWSQVVCPVYEFYADHGAQPNKVGQ